MASGAAPSLDAIVAVSSARTLAEFATCLSAAACDLVACAEAQVLQRAENGFLDLTRAGEGAGASAIAAAQYALESDGMLYAEAVSAAITIGDDVVLTVRWAREDDGSAERQAALHALARIAIPALEALRSRIQMHAALDAMTDSYYALDRHWTMVAFNAAAEDYFQLKREDVIGRNLWELFPAGRGRPYEKLCRQAMDLHVSARMEAPSAFRPGNLVEMRVAPIDGGICVTITDITERKRADAELKRQKEELQALLDAAPVAIFIAQTPDATEITGNSFAHRLLRMPTGANLAKTVPQNTHFRVYDDAGEELAPVNFPLRRAGRGERVEACQQRFVFEDGTEVHLLGNAVPMLDANGEPWGAVAAFVDVTELKRVEKDLRELARSLEVRIAAAVADREEALGQLHEAQKVEALGQIAGGMAHDFNNLLTPIIGGMQLLRRRNVGADERAARLIDGALESAERARALVQRMLAFARRQPLDVRAIDIAALMTSLEKLFVASLGPRIALSFDVAPDLAPALADSNQLELALLNLVLNARDAMPEGGRLTISAARAPRDADTHWLRITVTDTGEGMDAETLKRAIEPFFSTKGVGRGTGLGLSMVHGLAGQLGGMLRIASTPRVGTSVALYLPEATGAVEVSANARGDATLGAGSVLLVDDEELVRTSVKDMLEDLGFAVTEAASARDALRLVDAGAAFDWIVTDHMMPEMTGIDLARAVRQRRPQAKVLIISGYADLDEIAPDLPRLAKPFQLEELGRRLAGGDQ